MCCCDKNSGTKVISLKLDKTAHYVPAKGAFEVRIINTGKATATLWGVNDYQEADEDTFCTSQNGPFLNDFPLSWPDGTTLKCELSVLLFRVAPKPEDWDCDPRTDPNP